MTKNKGSRTVKAAALAATALNRQALLNAIARDTGKLDCSVAAWAKFELTAMREKRTTYGAAQADVCGKFPRFTGKKGKLSDTPNDSFRSNWNAFTVLAHVLGHATMRSDNADRLRSPECVAAANAWVNSGKEPLRTIVATLQKMARKPSEKLSKAERDALRQREHNENSAKLGAATALNAIALVSQAAALRAASEEKLEGLGAALADLYGACRDAAKRLTAYERAQKKAA